MRRLLVLLLVSIVLAGCTGTAPVGGDRSAGPSEAATSTPTETPWRSTAPDLSHEVRVENRLGRAVNLSVAVVRERTDERVYTRNLTVHPGEREVYNTVAADPEGDERFHIVATWNGSREDTYLRTTNCFTDAHVVVSEDGELSAYVVLC